MGAIPDVSIHPGVDLTNQSTYYHFRYSTTQCGGGEDSTPVRGALYEPTVVLGVSVEPRLSQRECF